VVRPSRTRTRIQPAETNPTARRPAPRNASRGARHRVPARWTSPRRGRGQGVLGCGRQGLTRAHAFDCKETTQHTGDRGTAPARHMSWRCAAGWPSVQPTPDEAKN
jgi:hypothetical protein